MKYTKEQFIKDVKKEARALNKHATKEEKDRLSIELLNPDHQARCIYGLIGGNCRSMRSIELIEKCCPRYFLNRRDNAYREKKFKAVKANVNGTRIGNNTRFCLLKEKDTLEHFSSIEAYILIPWAKNKNLIDFLQGKRKDLVL